MNLTQRQLRLFVTTAAFGHITRASAALHITQPALTRALRDFETQLGVELFARTTRRLALTPQGERFLPQAQRLLADMEKAVQALDGPPTGLDGRVTLAVGVAFACTRLPAVLAAFAQAHPASQVRVVTANSGQIMAAVARAEVDLGIASPVGDAAALRCEPLLSSPLGLLGRPELLPSRRTARVDDLPQLPLLKDGADTSIMQLLRAHGPELVARMHRGIEVSDLSVQIALAQAGVGVAVLSALGASHAAAAGLRFLPLRPVMKRTLYLMQRRDARADPLTQALAEALRATRAVSVSPP